MPSEDCKVRVPRAALRRALDILRATTPKHSTSYGDTGVLLEDHDGHLRLSSTYNSGLTRVEVPEAEINNGPVLIEYHKLLSEVLFGPENVLDLSFSRARSIALERFAPRVEELPHAAWVDGDRFRKELQHLVRVAAVRHYQPVQHGVHFWFEAGAVGLRLVNAGRMTTVLVPAEVTPEAIGREAFVPMRELQLVRPGLSGPQVALGLSADATLFSVASGPTSLIMATGGDEPAAPPLFTEAAETIVIDRHQALNALRAVEREPDEWLSVRLPVVVHLDARQLRITRGFEDDPDEGPVMLVGARRLRTALRTMTGSKVAVHLANRRPFGPVALTDPNARLGALTWRHDVIMQAPDPRPSQRRGPMPPLLPVVYGAARCALRPRTIAALRSTAIDDETDLRGFAPCQREHGTCSSCPVMREFITSIVLPPRLKPLLVRVIPVAGPEADELWLMETPAGDDWTPTPRQILWDQVTALHGLTVGQSYEDEHSEGFWLISK